VKDVLHRLHVYFEYAGERVLQGIVGFLDQRSFAVAVLYDVTLEASDPQTPGGKGPSPPHLPPQKL
jgi:hypothetical protein